MPEVETQTAHRTALTAPELARRDPFEPELEVSVVIRARTRRSRWRRAARRRSGNRRARDLRQGIVAGGGLLVAAILRWRRVDFGDLDYPETMRLAIPGATLSAFAFQTALSSFLVSMLGLERRR